MRVLLGDKVRDTITGLTGIAIARTEWMHGCIRIQVQPQELKEGKMADCVTVDEPQLEVLEHNAVPNDPFWRDETVPRAGQADQADQPETGRRAAGPRPEVTRPRDPTR